MLLERPVLLGRREPRISNVPAYAYSDGQEAVELAEAAGLVLDPWQRDVLIGACGCREDGRWSAPEVCIICARQNGKNAILEARELAGLYLFGEQLILHSAHEFKTAQEAFLRIKALVDNTDDLRKKVRRIRASHGEEGIELLSGQRLRFVARSSASGRGFTPDVIILDEAYALTEMMVGAMFPGLSGRSIEGIPQTWYTSSAGDETSYALARVRERGHEGSDRLAFWEWSAPDDADLDDREFWVQANPALGVRISEEAVMGEREAMSDADFARERLGVWPHGILGRAIPAEVWDAVCFSDIEARRHKAEIGVEIAPDHSSGAMAAWDGQVGEVVAHRAGVNWIVDKAEELAAKYRCSFVMDGNGPASAYLRQAFERRNLATEYLSNPDVYAACAQIYQAVADGNIKVRAAVELDEAVAVAQKKTVSGDRFVWRRDVGDITPFFALTLAFRPGDVPRVPLIAYI